VVSVGGSCATRKWGRRLRLGAGASSGMCVVVGTMQSRRRSPFHETACRIFVLRPQPGRWPISPGPIAPSAPYFGAVPRCRSSASPRQSRWPPPRTNEAPVGGLTLPASTQCKAGCMTAVSLRPNVREPRFQMYHYRGCARAPLMSWRCEPLSLAYFSLRPAKRSECRPAQGQR
jgi:hypothetical protein